MSQEALLWVGALNGYFNVMVDDNAILSIFIASYKGLKYTDQSYSAVENGHG
jgi:hypothetical protein